MIYFILRNMYEKTMIKNVSARCTLLVILLQTFNQTKQKFPLNSSHKRKLFTKYQKKGRIFQLNELFLYNYFIWIRY